MLKEKPAIYKTCNFLDSGQACLVTTYHLGTKENRSLHIHTNTFLPLCKISMFKWDYV